MSKELSANFPDFLDGSAVLLFSQAGNFGKIEGDSRQICYFAICQYSSSASYYLFFCASDYEVVIADSWDSIELCKKTAASFGDIVWIQK